MKRLINVERLSSSTMQLYRATTYSFTLVVYPVSLLQHYTESSTTYCTTL